MLINRIKKRSGQTSEEKHVYLRKDRLYSEARRNEVQVKDSVKALSVNTRKAVMQVIDNSVTYKPIIYTMMGMGLRIGEVIALK